MLRESCQILATILLAAAVLHGGEVVVRCVARKDVMHESYLTLRDLEIDGRMPFQIEDGHVLEYEIYFPLKNPGIGGYIRLADSELPRWDLLDPSVVDQEGCSYRYNRTEWMGTWHRRSISLAKAVGRRIGDVRLSFKDRFTADGGFECGIRKAVIRDRFGATVLDLTAQSGGMPYPPPFISLGNYKAKITATGSCGISVVPPSSLVGSGVGTRIRILVHNYDPEETVSGQLVTSRQGQS